MQKYYISHPHCRFSLRILASPQKGGAKGRSEDIVYAPSKSVQEAVQKAVGKDVAAACEWIDTSSAAYAEALAEDDAEDSGEDTIVLEAFLPKPGTDPAVISRKPQCTHFISVDSRSVSCARGTLKQVHSLYKSYLKSTSTTGLSDPFIYLNIRCPPGTYDPNIEPTKDDVLFDDGDAVIKSIENMLKRFYGELKSEERGGKWKAPEVAKLNGFELLLARKPKAPVTAPAPAPKAKEHWPKPAPLVRPPEDTDYDGIDEDEEEMAAMAMDTVMGSGGFVAVNSPAFTRRAQKEPEPRALNHEDEDHPMPPIEDDPAPVNDEELKEADQVPVFPEPEPETAAPTTNMNAPNLTTPKRKSTNWGFNMSGGLDEDDDDELTDEVLEQHASDNEETARQDITISNPWTTAKMNAPLVSSPIVTSPSLPPPRARRPFNPPTRRSPASPENARNGFPTPAPSSPSARIFRENRGSVIPRTRSEKKNASAGLMKTWISRTPRGSRVEEGEGAQTTSKSKSKGFVSAAKVHKERTSDAQDDDEHDEHQPRQKRPTRKETTKRSKPDASKRQRLDQEDSTPINLDDYDLGPAPVRPSPHKNRFLAATAALNPPPEPAETEPDDPPLQPPERRSKRRRTRTLLPLDCVPEPFLQTHSITKRVDLASGGRLKSMFMGLRESDGYVGGTAAGMATEGKEVGGLFFSESEGWDDLEALGGVLKGWLKGFAEREGMGDVVEGMGWEWGEGEEGERVVLAVGVEEEGGGGVGGGEVIMLD